MDEPIKKGGRRRAAMREDSPEMINKCLSCTRGECTNCLQWQAKNKGRRWTVIAYREGDDDMLFESAKEAGEFFNYSAQVVRQAIKQGKMWQGHYWRYA